MIALKKYPDDVILDFFDKKLAMKILDVLNKETTSSVFDKYIL